MSNLNTVIKAIISSSKEPVSGYDIAKLIKNKSGNIHQQIYKELKKISAEGGYNVDIIYQDGLPDRKVYSVGEKKSSLDWFTWEQGKASDYSKTSIAYEILTVDTLTGTNNFDEYVKVMREAEEKFLKEAGLR